MHHSLTGVKTWMRKVEAKWAWDWNQVQSQKDRNSYWDIPAVSSASCYGVHWVPCLLPYVFMIRESPSTETPKIIQEVWLGNRLLTVCVKTNKCLWFFSFTCGLGMLALNQFWMYISLQPSYISDADPWSKLPRQHRNGLRPAGKHVLKWRSNPGKSSMSPLESKREHRLHVKVRP